ncbi:GH1 family beta-glucosidase [Opitutus sp. ER46]|uniref:GH1 family beta-glucosidase n=1 Tax=Opitutus sp. ER46 TaxID=2161864 RepID=UPI000D31F3AC|nr:GH1 family beta-glucosidase [Opitutus sp. ER46]PTX91400.1 beta-glucosidase [Opitutus sp. ER46]
MNFPADFTWGVAAAAYQIEGAAALDGRAPSIWDVYTHQPGNIFEGHTGDVACDHYHRYAEDVALMRDLGVSAYRLSLSWPRIIPDGTGAANAKGLEFYDRLIDALLAAGITPWVTLYHWDLPQALQQRGGFLNREFVEWFGAYATIVAQRLGDRVKHWMTFNEPPCSIGLGLQEAVHAPGLKLSFRECLLGAHHLLLAHGTAVQALRAGCRDRVKVSLALTGRERIPATESATDIEAARRDYFACHDRSMWNLSWWGDPVYLGHYPEEGLRAFGADVPAFTDADLKLIAQPLDFMGYNCYSGWLVRARADGTPEQAPGGWGIGNPRGTLSWLNVAPSAPYWAARMQHERYGLPVVFTENGFCNTDFVHLDGQVHDPQRIDFMARYLATIGRALKDGVPVAGYFYWSVLDNFEWKEGYKDRFGLIHVDYQTQKRTPKDSYAWYRETIRARGANLPVT